MLPFLSDIQNIFRADLSLKLSYNPNPDEIYYRVEEAHEWEYARIDGGPDRRKRDNTVYYKYRVQFYINISDIKIDIIHKTFFGQSNYNQTSKILDSMKDKLIEKYPNIRVTNKTYGPYNFKWY